MANLTYAQLVTPERVLFAGEAEAVIMRVDGGDTTFLANHSDFIGAVDICVVRIQAAQSGGSAADSVAPVEASDGARGAGAGPSGGGASGAGAGSAGGAAGAAVVGPSGSSAPGESTSLGEVRAAVHGGFVKVADNKVTIVAGVAELADEIDVARAQRALEAAEARGVAVSAAATTGMAEEVESGTAPGDSDAVAAANAAARARVRLEAASASSAELSHA